jgi:hypothetical protein
MDTLAVESIDENRRVAVHVPAGSVIRVAKGPVAVVERALVEVVWASHRLTMFFVDLQDRGERITSTDTT